MTYTLLYTHSAVQDIKKLDPIAKKRIKKKLEEYSITPISYAKKIIHPRIGSHRWRVGNYRIVFDLEESKIIILRVGHRREIYR